MRRDGPSGVSTSQRPYRFKMIKSNYFTTCSDLQDQRVAEGRLRVMMVNKVRDTENIIK